MVFININMDVETHTEKSKTNAKVYKNSSVLPAEIDCFQIPAKIVAYDETKMA